MTAGKLKKRRERRTAVSVICVNAGFATGGNLELILRDDLVHSEGAAAEEFACVAVAAKY